MVNCGATFRNKRTYPVTHSAKRKVKGAATDSGSVRATISFPADLYATLEEIARDKKVSLAWVVRDAAEQYIREKWPLFKGRP
jgi:predicted DNA-binding ribbon-helix-helix protein